jgi:hypothetical protein
LRVVRASEGKLAERQIREHAVQSWRARPDEYSRPYQRSHSPDDAIQLLRTEVEHGLREKAIVEAFARIVGSGERAVVAG